MSESEPSAEDRAFVSRTMEAAIRIGLVFLLVLWCWEIVGPFIDPLKERKVKGLGLPKGAVIGAIVRGDEVLIAHHDTVIEAEDHVVMFLLDKRRIAEVEKLFQVGITFF